MSGPPGRYAPQPSPPGYRVAGTVSQCGVSLLSPVNISKAEEAGRIWIEVDPRHTSDRCESCGQAVPDNRVTQANFLCTACGHGPTQADEYATRGVIFEAHCGQRTGQGV